MQQITIAIAVIAGIQFQLSAQLLIADGARLRPIAMMIGPVTTGGKNFMTLPAPKVIKKYARTKSKRPETATPKHAYGSNSLLEEPSLRSGATAA